MLLPRLVLPPSSWWSSFANDFLAPIWAYWACFDPGSAARYIFKIFPSFDRAVPLWGALLRTVCDGVKKKRKKKKAQHLAGFKPTSSRIYAPEASAQPLRYNHGPICKLLIYLGFWDPRLEFLCPFVLLPEVSSRRGWTGRGWSRLSAGPRSDRGGWAGRGRRPSVGWRSPTRTRSAATGWTRCWNR